MHQLNEQKIRDIVNWINLKRIEMFIGYPSIMTTFANELMNVGMALDFLLNTYSRELRNCMRISKSILQTAFLKDVQIHELYRFF